MAKIKEVFKGYLKGVHRCKDHSRVKLYKIVKNSKGQSDLAILCYIGYLALLIIATACIF